MKKMSEMLVMVEGDPEAEYTVRDRIPEAELVGSIYRYEVKQDPTTLQWYWEEFWRGESVNVSKEFNTFEEAYKSAEGWL